MYVVTFAADDRLAVAIEQHGIEVARLSVPLAIDRIDARGRGDHRRGDQRLGSLRSDRPPTGGRITRSI